MHDIVALSNGWCILDPTGNIVPNSVTHTGTMAAWRRGFPYLQHHFYDDNERKRHIRMREAEGYVCVGCQVLVREEKEAASGD